MNLNEERSLKLDKIKEVYDQRNTQEFIAEKFKMDISDVSAALIRLGYIHTRKKNLDNLKPGELVNPIIMLDELEFLDKYPLNNFIYY